VGALFPQFFGVRLHVSSLWIGFLAGAMSVIAAYLLGRLVLWGSLASVRARPLRSQGKTEQTPVVL
jgi:hypothetical protein